jgi:potassium efflux system protein
LSRYVIVTVVVLVVLGRLGASWSQMGWAVAAMSVGIGFGLQEIVANFISGLILLVERPIRLGDVITIGDASGTVTRIRFRATTVRDFDRKELIVPNKEIITGRLLNWTLSDPVTRIVVPVGVAYGSDVETAMRLMREAAEENERVLEDPHPFVIFEQFADSSLSLTLRAWVGSFAARLVVRTELHQAINEKFNAAAIVIAFPQQDVHVYRHSPYEDTPPDAEGLEGA